MDPRDRLRLTFGALRGHPLRTGLSILGISIGIASVILLTSIGEGTRRYVLSQFTQFGTNLLSINPGKVETVGLPHVFGGTTRKLTIDDAEALRRVPGVLEVVPVAVGQARVEGGGRGRSVYVYGVTSGAPDLWKFRVQAGSFLPAGDPRRGGSVAVLGPKLKRELFGEGNALGETVRIGGVRCRVIGVKEPRGRLLGFDLDDSVDVPVATAMRMFNLEELWEIDLSFAREDLAGEVERGIREALKGRHGGREDFTIVTQAAMLAVFGRVMTVVTASVGAIGGISLLVGAIGILTMMWIAVGERTAEIGLVRSFGATSRQVGLLFLAESALLSLAGGAVGVGGGLAAAGALRAILPGLPIRTPAETIAAALLVSLGTGILSGILPARHAAALEPIEALRAE